ncbi:MAG: RNA 2',3'-cyclic phosphodiesterase [Candidatus Calescibacterium sp.]|nr:RNA 2',3'-cyclic phosphodiesterase [Candidatus Calescibacterium sp.]MCX7972663.1 RNA 2',3'-cyclic phosphodiesterase [bacterium]MDW8194740.1 RNA 2',3'-cyclic phosphodiesterase [Candidatus Calescibacterium sp.]
MRAFIALDLPYEIKNFITVQLFSLKQKFRYEDIKWVETQNYHLTFRFFESIEKDIALNKFRMMKEKMNYVVPVSIQIVQHLGFFYSNDRIRVIFLILEPEEFFFEIYKVVKEFFGSDRFTPHVTVGRVRKSLTTAQENFLKEFTIEHISFFPREIALFRSELTPLGPVYHKLDSFVWK